MTCHHQTYLPWAACGIVPSLDSVDFSYYCRCSSGTSARFPERLPEMDAVAVVEQQLATFNRSWILCCHSGGNLVEVFLCVEFEERSSQIGSNCHAKEGLDWTKDRLRQ